MVRTEVSRTGRKGKSSAAATTGRQTVYSWHKTSCQIQDRSSSSPWTPSGRHDPKQPLPPPPGDAFIRHRRLLFLRPVHVPHGYRVIWPRVRQPPVAAGPVATVTLFSRRASRFSFTVLPAKYVYLNVQSVFAPPNISYACIDALVTVQTRRRRRRDNNVFAANTCVRPRSVVLLIILFTR